MRAVSVSIYSGIHMVGNGTQERIYSVNSLLNTGTREDACVCVCKCVCVCVCVCVYSPHTNACIYSSTCISGRILLCQLDLLVPSCTTQRKPFSSTQMNTQSRVGMLLFQTRSMFDKEACRTKEHVRQTSMFRQRSLFEACLNMKSWSTCSPRIPQHKSV